MNKDYQEYLGKDILNLYKAAKQLITLIEDEDFMWDTYNTDYILFALKAYSQKIDI